MTRRLGAPVLALMAGVILGACTGPGVEVPSDRFYRLPDPRPVAPASDQPVTGTLTVVRVEADGLHQERAVLYLQTQRPLQLERHHYHFWADSPPRMLQERLLDYLRQSGIAEQVVREPAGQRPDLRLRGYLQRFERVLEADGSAFVVELELVVEDGHGRVRLQRTYAATESAAGPGVHAAAEAAGRALDRLFAQLVADLRRL